MIEQLLFGSESKQDENSKRQELLFSVANL